MIYFLDTPNELEVCASELGVGSESIGQLLTPLTRRANRGGRWAADNGAFARFDADGFKRLLERNEKHRDRCEFVAVPDVVGSARRTLEVWREWAPELAFWPVALVAQDGIEDLDIPWREMRAVFIGGSNEFKMSNAAHQVARAARALGKWVHVGRVNTPGRLAAWEDDADSCDGTGLARYTHMREAMRSNPEPLLRTSGSTGEVQFSPNGAEE